MAQISCLTAIFGPKRHESRAVRLFLLLTLTVAVAVVHWQPSFHGIHLNAERIVIPLVAVVTLAIYRPWWRQIRLGPPHVALLIYLLTAFIAVFSAPERGESFRVVVLIAVVAIPLIVVPGLITDSSLMRAAFTGFVAVATLQAMVGIMQLLVFQFLHVNLGLQLDPASHAMVPYGLQWEGNTFGSFVGAGLVALIGWLAGSEHGPRVHPGILVFSGVMMAIGVAASASRGAWIAVTVGAILVLLLGQAKRRWAMAAALSLCGVLFGVAALVLTHGRGLGAITHRLNPGTLLIGGSVDPPTAERLYTFRLAWESALQRPLIGWGPGSFGQQFTYLGENAPGWVANLELHAFHDTGLIGLAALLTALIVPIAALGMQLRAGSLLEPEQRAISVGLLAAAVSLLVAFQFTEATYLGYTWLVFGLAWSAALRHPVPSTAAAGSG
jgi:O-antigen ligase